jgi:hypothetical protein
LLVAFDRSFVRWSSDPIRTTSSEPLSWHAAHWSAKIFWTFASASASAFFASSPPPAAAGRRSRGRRRRHGRLVAGARLAIQSLIVFFWPAGSGSPPCGICSPVMFLPVIFASR